MGVEDKANKKGAITPPEVRDIASLRTRVAYELQTRQAIAIEWGDKREKKAIGVIPGRDEDTSAFYIYLEGILGVLDPLDTNWNRTTQPKADTIRLKATQGHDDFIEAARLIQTGFSRVSFQVGWVMDPLQELRNNPGQAKITPKPALQ